MGIICGVIWWIDEGVDFIVFSIEELLKLGEAEKNSLYFCDRQFQTISRWELSVTLGNLCDVGYGSNCQCFDCTTGVTWCCLYQKVDLDCVSLLRSTLWFMAGKVGPWLRHHEYLICLARKGDGGSAHASVGSMEPWVCLLWVPFACIRFEFYWSCLVRPGI